jgi:HD-GYP domain-containing protein (c-di-GMP phosphodiesterase class II)
MNENKKALNTYTFRRRLLPGFTLTVFCILINIFGAQFALRFELPLYLDCIGTVLAASLGGYLPAIIVGYVTNLVNGLADQNTTYYCVISVLIAVYASFIASRGCFKKFYKAFMNIPVFAFIGGGLGSVLTWAIYGFSFGSGISAPFAYQLHDSLHMSEFSSQFTADMLLDFADKAISITAVYFLYKAFSPLLEKITDFNAWRQTPLTKRELDAANKSTPWVHSLRFKLTVLISVTMFAIAAVTTLISFKQFEDATVSSQSKLGTGVAAAVANAVDAERIDEFLENGESAEGYTETKEAIEGIKQSFDDIEFVYVYKILEDGCHVVFDLDTEDVEASEVGTVIPFEEAFLPYKQQLLAGEEIEPVISHDSYGYLLTVYKPMYNSAGKCVCYAATDISMNALIKHEYSFLAKEASLYLSFFVLILAVGLWLAKYNIILPLNTMAMAAEEFAFRSSTSKERAIKKLSSLNISTGDEIENLYRAFSKTSEDTVRYIADIQKKSETIAHMQDSLIIVLADMVESRDKYTGDHIKKTAAYLEVIMKQMKADGLYPDIITDEYIADAVHSAPLHDIGKIQISDTILNKPSKLTDEEFTKMKSHTVSGKYIISQAADAVSESGYLAEAEKLAAYHHEKWDGSGYPFGLAGEDIPISARAMAVADVFDALISKRSYKEGYPIEKAFEIIREGSGTHFDPKVVTAFFNAEEKIRAVAGKDMKD